MGRSELLLSLSALEPRLRREGVTAMALFGSRARGDNRPDSDVDVMIDVDGQSRFSLLSLVGVGHVIEDAIGLEANVFMRRSLDDDIRQSAMKDAIQVFG